MDKIKMTKKDLETEKKLSELTTDLQRTRADFENFRKRADIEKLQAKESGKVSAILHLLPVIDNIERAISYAPDDLKDNQWVQGVTSLTKNLEKSLESMDLKRIIVTPGDPFDPEIHDAISMDEDAVGDSLDSEEVIAEELQAGYMLGDLPIRHAMVRVTRK